MRKQAAIRQAFAQARRRIRRDRRRVTDADVGRLLELIAGQLGHVDFDLDELDGLSAEVLWGFRTEVGVDPKAYRTQRRLELAHHLVCATEVPFHVIAESLGFKGRELFTKWFKRGTGRAPKKLRRPTSESPATSGGERVTAEGDCPMREWRRIVMGVGEPGAAAELIRRLRTGSPPPSGGEPAE